jgi:hypothetical protein
VERSQRPPLLELAQAATIGAPARGRPAQASGKRRAAVDAFALTRADSSRGVVALDVPRVLFPPLTTRVGATASTPALDATPTRRTRSECLERQPRQAPAAPRLVAPNLHASSPRGRHGLTALRTRRPRSRTSRFTLAEAGRSATPEFLWEFLSRKSGPGSPSLRLRRRGIPPTPKVLHRCRRSLSAIYRHSRPLSSLRLKRGLGRDGGTTSSRSCRRELQDRHKTR